MRCWAHAWIICYEDKKVLQKNASAFKIKLTVSRLQGQPALMPAWQPEIIDG
jgi:hypothetical protein